MPPIVIAGAISAVAAVTASVIQSKVINKAEKTQAAATAVAKADITKAKDEAQAYLKPYVDSGAKANATLASMMGLGGPPGAGSATPGVPGPIGSNVPAPVTSPVAPAPGVQVVPPGTSPGVPLREAVAEGATSSGYAVRMQAPDGSIQAVQAQAIPHFLQRGARIVG